MRIVAGHRHDPTPVSFVRYLVTKKPRGTDPTKVTIVSASEVVRSRAARLEKGIGDHAMKTQAIVEPLRDESEKVRRVVWRRLTGQARRLLLSVDHNRELFAGCHDG